MPDTQAPDDIFALFSRFDLDMAQYRVFQREAPAIESATDEAACIALSEPEKDLPIAVAFEAAEPETSWAHEDDEERQKAPTRSALGSLQRVLQVNRPASPARMQTAPAMAISIVGAAGGVGVTTIAATLARQFNKEGGRCAIYDTGSDSLLPLFFENRQLTSSHRRFSGLHSLLESSVQILTPDACAKLDLAANGDPASWIDNVTTHFSSDFDHIFFDCGRTEKAHVDGLTIHVAIPDVASVFGIQRLAAQWNVEGRRQNTICVLNRFDAGLALHQELRSWYEDHFAEVFTIDNSHLVSEALAEGATVADWAPQSDAAGDLMRLAGHVRRATQKKSSPAATKNQPEGLALCS